jgi:heme A synthase
MIEDPGLFVEHGHRIVMWAVGFLTLAVAAFAWKRTRRDQPAKAVFVEGRAWVRKLALAAVFLIIVPASLGALAVEGKLHPALSITHVAFAMLFLSALVTLAVVTGRRWDEAATIPPADAKSLARLAVSVVVAIYVQVLLGAVSRHATAEHGGRTMVAAGNAAHIAWAFVVFALVILAAGRILGRHSKSQQLLRPALALLVLLVLQVFLGFAAFLSQPKDPAPVVVEGGLVATGPHVVVASVHQAVGVLLLVTSLVGALRALRCAAATRDEAARVAPSSP